MHDADPITWVNSVLPMAILAALAVLVPLGLVRKQTRSQAKVSALTSNIIPAEAQTFGQPSK